MSVPSSKNKGLIFVIQRLVLPYSVILVMGHGLMLAFMLSVNTVSIRIPFHIYRLTYGLMFFISTVSVVTFAARKVDRDRTVREYGLWVDRPLLYELIAGICIGLVGGSIPYLLGISAGIFEVGAIVDGGIAVIWPKLMISIVTALLVALWEELLHRGVLMTNTIEGLLGRCTYIPALVGGVIVSSLVFGQDHIGQFDEPVFFLTYVFAGVVFCIFYLLTGYLILSVGCHTGCNIVFQIVLVRADVTGGDSLPAIVRLEPTDPLVIYEFGGIFEISAFLNVLVLGCVWIWWTRGRLQNYWRQNVL